MNRVLLIIILSKLLTATNSSISPKSMAESPTIGSRSDASQYLMVFGGCGAGSGGCTEDGGDIVHLLSLEPNVQVRHPFSKAQE